MDFDITLLSKKSPELLPVLNRIKLLDSQIACLPIEQFFEPISVIEASKDEHQLLSPEAADLSSWTKHMAFSTRLRMRTVEPGILRELCAARYLPAMVLLRSHMEAAGLASLCIQELTSSAQSGDFSPLSTLIPMTLFGTALVKEAKKKPQYQDLLTFTEGRTITICKAIEALDKFFFQQLASGQTSWTYGILCEYSHPNLRGTRAFVFHRELGNAGWIIQYQDKEQEEGEIAFALDTLLMCMQAGYAASEMLRLATFRQEPTRIAYESIGIDELNHIWVDILQRSIGQSEKG